MRVELDKIVDDLGINKDAVWYFFVLFFRFECAMKRSKYLKAKRPPKHRQECGCGNEAVADSNKDEAIADWDSLAKDFEQSIQRWRNEVGSEFKEAVEYLQDKPPMKQCVDGGQVEFMADKYDQEKANANRILVLVRRVRNNLFHGGKYPGKAPTENAEAEPGRNEKLLLACIEILWKCVGVEGELRSRFFETE